LGARIKKHGSAKNKESVVSLHANEYQYTFNFPATKILDRKPMDNKRLVSKMLFIQCDDKTINMKEDTQYSNRVYCPFTRRK